MKRVLIIAYYFPPVGGSGVLRPTKFVKYLPDFGWTPSVICASRTFDGDVDSRDDSLLGDVPEDVRVWRIPTPSPQPVNRLARLMGWRASSTGDLTTGLTGAANDDPSVHPGQSRSRSRRIRRLLLAPLNLIQNPPVDRALYWSLKIVPLACRIIKRERIDAVLTTAPPFSPLIAGAMIKSLTGVAWIADMRDPWTDNPLVYFPTPMSKAFDVRLERLLLSRADALITVTRPLLDQFVDRLPPGRRRRELAVIPNGWDQADVVEPDGGSRQACASPSDGKIRIAYTGSSYKGGPAAILDALQAPELDHVLVARLDFHFVGYMHPDDSSRITRSQFKDNFTLAPDRIPHSAAIGLMQSSDVLLLMGYHPHFSPGKAFDYMLAGKPVLAIAEGVAAEIVRECEIGCVVRPNCPSELAAALQWIASDYEGFVAACYHPNPDAIRQYDRRVLTGQLAQVLDAVSRP